MKANSFSANKITLIIFKLNLTFLIFLLSTDLVYPFNQTDFPLTDCEGYYQIFQKGNEIVRAAKPAMNPNAYNDFYGMITGNTVITEMSIPSSICDNTSFAVQGIFKGKVYFFKGSEYIRFDIASDKQDPGYPKAISAAWQGLWSSGIDAAVNYGNGKVYFFKGSEYIRYDIATDKADPGYPKTISAAWKGLWSSGIDAAVNYGNGKVYFFKGGEYIRYDIATDKADPGYPKPISIWKLTWTDGIDAATIIN